MQTLHITTLIAVVAMLAAPVMAQRAPANQAHEAQILDFQKDGEGGIDVVVAGPPGKLYGLMSSEDGANWELVGIAAEMEPGIYLANAEEGAGKSRRLFVIVSRDDQYRQYGQENVEAIAQSTPGFEDLTEKERGPVRTAAQKLIDATNHLSNCRNALIGLERNVADCVKLVAAAKLAMERAQDEAAVAEKAAKDAASALSGINSYLTTARADLATAQSRTDQWEHEMNVLLDWATKAEAAGNSFHAQQYRDNAANAQAKYEDWSAETDRIAESIADEEAKIEAAEAAVTTSAGAAANAAAAAVAAEAAYEKAKTDCDPSKTAAQGKRDEIEEAKADAGDRVVSRVFEVTGAGRGV